MSIFHKAFLKKASLLPKIELITETAFTDHSFVFPNPWQNALGQLPNSAVNICWVGFGVSPLNDRIYVDGLYVNSEYQRFGYATSLLQTLVAHASPVGKSLPITALFETGSAVRFWNKLRERKLPGLLVTTDVRVGDMKAEAARWKIQQ